MSFTTVLEHSERTGDTEGIWGGWLDSSGGREKNYHVGESRKRQECKEEKQKKTGLQAQGEAKPSKEKQVKAEKENKNEK